MAERPQREPVFLKLVITRDVYKKLDQFKRNWRDHNPVDVIVRVETGNELVGAQENVYSMTEFLDALGLEEVNEMIKPCSTCDGLGEVSYSEAVYPGEPHMADVGSKPCPDCTGHDEEES